MAVTRQRVVAGFFAGLFIISSCMITVAVIYQMIQDNKKADIGKAAQHALQNASTQQNNSKENDVTKLQGTQLAGFTPVPNIAGLQKIDMTPGTGTVVKAGDFVSVDYTGAVASTGIIFQSSKDSTQTLPPFELKAGSLIEGWVQGVPGMQEGGTRRLLIPAALAYGSNPPPGSGIPANADLVFDITVKKIGK